MQIAFLLFINLKQKYYSTCNATPPQVGHRVKICILQFAHSNARVATRLLPWAQTKKSKIFLSLLYKTTLCRPKKLSGNKILGRRITPDR